MPTDTTTQKQDPFDAFLAQRDKALPVAAAPESDPFDAFVAQRDAQADVEKAKAAAKVQEEAVASTKGKIKLPLVKSTLVDKALGALATEPIEPLPPKSDAERAALAKQAASIDPFEAASRARLGVPLQKEGTAGNQFLEDLQTGSKKMPIPAFTEPGPTNPYPLGLRVSNVGELTDLTNEYLNRPDIPKTREEAFEAGFTADAVKTLNDIFLSPVGIASAGTGLIAASALSKAGRSGTEALKLLEEYQAMQRAGATPAELLVQQGKMQQAIQAATKAQGTVKAAATAGRMAGAGFAAQGGDSVVEGIKQKDPSKIIAGLSQIAIAGAGELGIRKAGGIENAVKGATAEAAQKGFEERQPVTGAARTPQIPEEAALPPEPAGLLEQELGQAKADVAAEKLETAAKELRKAAKVPKTSSKPVEKPEVPTSQTKELAGSTEQVPQEEPTTAPAATETIPGPEAGRAEGAPSVGKVTRQRFSPEENRGAMLQAAVDMKMGQDPGLIAGIIDMPADGPFAGKTLGEVLRQVPEGSNILRKKVVQELERGGKTEVIKSPETGHIMTEEMPTEKDELTAKVLAATPKGKNWTTTEIQRRYSVGYGRASQILTEVQQAKNVSQETIARKVEETKPIVEVPVQKKVPFAKKAQDKALISAAESGRPEAGTAGSPPATQEPLRQVSAEGLPSEPTTTRTTSPSETAGAPITEPTFIPPSTKRVLHEPNDVNQLMALAKEKAPQLQKTVDQIAAAVPGVTARVRPEKTIERINEKIAKDNRQPNQVSDYLGAKIVVDSPEQYNQVLDHLRKLHPTVEEDNFFAEGKPSKGGHRAHNLQLDMGDGFTAEVQVVPKEVDEVSKQTHALYEQMRKPETTAEEYVAAQKEAAKLNEDAWNKFQERQKAITRVPFARKSLTQTGASATLPVEKRAEQIQPEGTAGPVPAVPEPSKPSEEVLAGEPAEAVQRTEAGGTGEVSPVGGGANRPSGEPGSERVGGERVSVPKSVSGAAGQRPVRKPRAGSQLKPSSNSVGNDYHITAEDHLGEGGIGAKFDDNVAAIETLKKLEKENRKATPEEQKVLVKYVGWGGMPQAFDPYKRDWNTKYNQLKQLLTEEEYDAARGSTQFAHFTSEDVVRFIYDGLARMGFEGGRILEPAAGTGNFFGVMPVEMGANSKRVAVEIDPISGRIAQQLYQNADVRISPFEKVRFPQNFFDLVATNVPFSDVKPFDKAYDKLKLNLHNYFMVRSLDLLRPGGVEAVITSRYTMDSIDKRARGLLSDRADLIAAFRLPFTAFKQNANTEVVTDILFLKKRGPDQEASGEDFANALPVSIQEDGTLGKPLAESRYNVNEYFVKHPENVLGKFTKEGSMYGVAELSVALPASELPARLNQAIEKVPESAYEKYVPPDKTSENFDQMIAEKREVKPFGHIIQDKKVWQNDMTGERILPSGAHEPIFELVERKDLSPKQIKMVSNALILRDQARNILTSEYQDKAPAEIAGHRRKLNEAYDKFAKRHGPINSSTVARILHDDPDYPLLQALEKYEPRTKEAAKSDIFFKRTVSGKTAPTLTTAKDGMLYSLSEKGKLDWPFISDKLKKSVEEVRNELQEQGLIFKNPEGDWETSDDYLSGNVREKLAAAESAAGLDKQYQKNVDALAPIVPKDLTPGEIAVRLGASWIPPKVIERFAMEVLGFPRSDQVSVVYSPSPSRWIVRVGYGKDNAVNSTTWGTKTESGAQDFYGTDLLEMGLNLQSPKSYDRVGEKSEVNKDRTLAAQEKQANLIKKFSEWVWQDPDRANQLGRLYNDNYNSTVPWKGDGQHLTLPTLAAGKTLHPWVKDGIWRLMRQPTAYIAYEVGLGKTLVYLGGALEAKRVGKFRKPMIVAHNATIQGYAADAKAFFPTSNILVVTKKDLEAGNRQRFMARIATGDWDAVIVPHSSFGLLPARPETYERHMLGEIRAAREWLTLNKDEMDRKTVKQVEKAMDRIETRILKKIEKLKAKQDVTVFFEDLGVDALLVDEADVFKNLMYQTQMTRVSGLGNPEGSDRALDLLMKSRLMMERNNGAGVYFASGTPLSNSIAEVYGIQKYLQPRELEKLGISQFDAWAANFGNVIQQLESSPEDPTKFRVTSSFAEFNNLPDLARMWKGISDYRTGDMVGIKRPKVNVDYRALEPSAEQRSYVATELVQRAEAIRTRRVEPDEDNMLNVTTDGRKSALDMRLVDPNADDYPTGKINLLADDIVKEWKGSEERKGVQLVALDFSTPADKTPGKFMAYRDLTEKLVRRGIPREDIGWIHDADTDAKLATFIEKANTGKLRVILGSTNKMGVGMNLQKKAIGIHQVDVGWRPRDLEQRRGRVERYGNENEEVFERFWTTKKTFDAYMLQKNETKAKFIHRFLNGELTQRKGIEDISGRALTFGELKGITTGRPEVMEKNKVDIELDKLQRLSSQHEIEQINMRVKLGRDKSSLDTLNEDLVAAGSDVKTAEQKPAEFTAKIGKTMFDDRKEAGAALIDALAKADAFRTQKIEKVGEYSDFSIMVSGGPEVAGRAFLRGKLDYSISRSEDPVGIMRSMENRVDSVPAFRQGIEARISKTQTDIGELEKQIGKPFQKQEEMNDLIKRSMELAKILGMKEDDAQAAMAKEEKPPEEPAPTEEVGADNTLFTKQRKEAAEKRLRGKLLEARAGIDPTMLKDLAEIGGFYLEAGIRDFAEWSKKLIEHFQGTKGADKIEPHLKEIYERAIKAGEKQKPGFAANIRLSNVKAAEDVINVIKETARSQAGRIEEQRRGQVPFAKTQERGKQLVQDGHIREKDIANMKKGTALNDAELKAARSILVAISEDVAKALKNFRDDDSKDNLLRVMELVKRQRAVQAAVSGATAEAGRALNSMKIAAEGLRARSARQKAIDELGGELTEDMVRRLAQIPEDDHMAMNRFIRDHTQFSTMEKLNSYWIANILSGWQTHARVALSNAVWAGTQVAIRPLRGLIDAPVSRLLGTERKYYPGETLPALVGWFEGIPEGLRKAAWIMQNGYSLDNVTGEMLTDVKAPRYYEFPGGLKNPFNYPGRMLMAAHNLFRVASLESELAAIAARKALRAGGLAGVRQRFAQERANPEVEDIEQARKFARYTAFLDAPDSFSRLVIRMREWQVPPDWAVGGGAKPFRFIVPFINLPWNITKAGIEVTPAGAVRLLSKKARTEPGEAADILAKALLGAAVLATFAMVAMNGNLTGPVPKEAGKREEFYRLGRKPYSVKIGDKWYPYLRWGGPFGIGIASTAAWFDKYNSDGTIPTSERLTNAASAVGRAIFDQSFFTGLANLLDAIREGKTYSAKFAADVLSGFVPFSGMQRNVVQATDVHRDARSVYAKVAAGIPILSKTLPPQRDIFGRTTKQSIIGTESKDKVDQELARLGVQPGPLTDKIRLASIEFDLSPKGTDYFHKMTGELLYKTLAKTMDSLSYKSMNDFAKAKQIDHEVSLVRTAGKEVMLAKMRTNPEFKATPFYKLKMPFVRKTEAAAPGRP